MQSNSESRKVKKKKKQAEKYLVWNMERKQSPVSKKFISATRSSLYYFSSLQQLLRKFQDISNFSTATTTCSVFRTVSDILHKLSPKCNSLTFQIRKLKLKDTAYWKNFKQHNPQKQKRIVLAAILFWEATVYDQSSEKKINGLSIAELSNCMVDLFIYN